MRTHMFSHLRRLCAVCLTLVLLFSLSVVANAEDAVELPTPLYLGLTEGKSFAGATSGDDTGVSVNLGATFTLSAYFQLNELGGWPVMFAKAPKTLSGTLQNDHFDVYCDDANQLSFWAPVGGYIGTGIYVEDTEMHHFALVVDSGYFMAYLDGELVSENTYVGSLMPETNETIIVGGHSSRDDAPSAFNGSLRNVRIDNVALTDAQIAALASAETEIIEGGSNNDNTGDDNTGDDNTGDDNADTFDALTVVAIVTLTSAAGVVVSKKRR